MAVIAHVPAVIKIGGAVLDRLDRFWPLVKTFNRPVVIVHGGGKQSTELARRLGHQPRIISGRRVTTDLDLSVAEWAMRGEVNLKLVAEGQAHGLNCVGLSGADGNLLRVQKRENWTIDGEVVDFGWVGSITHVNCDLLHTLCSTGYVPVVAPLGLGPEGRRYNINADTVAGALAIALMADDLYLITDTGGLRRHADQPYTLIGECTKATFQRGVQDGWIAGGMQVKLQIAFEALESGVKSVYVAGPEDLIAQRSVTRVVH